MIWVVGFGGLSVIGGLALAVALNRPRRGVGIYRSAIYLPMVFSLAVTGLFWRVHVPARRPDQHRPRRRSAWTGAAPVAGRSEHRALRRAGRRGLAAGRLHHGALPRRAQGLRPQLDEAAAVDGATPVAAVPLIVMPQLRGVNTVVFAVTVIDSLRTFDIVWAMTRGGPYNTTQLLSTYMFQQGFTQ